jgi:imidazolonepropionase-like amidohydrolase
MLQEEMKNAVSVPVLMPGLWDCCCHYLGLRGELRMRALESHVLLGAITAVELKATLQAGYTSVREWGGFAGQVKPAVEQGVLCGPKIYSSHRPVYITENIEGKGHSLWVVAGVATPTGEALADISTPCVPCHGLDQCVKSVSELIHRGASFINICSRDAVGQTLSGQMIQAIIQEAAKCDRSVGAQFFDGAAIMEALKAGLVTIDNFMFLDKQTIELIKESGALLISRQHGLGIFDADVLSGLPVETAHSYRVEVQSLTDSFALAVKSGVKIALGSGLVSSINQGSKFLHGHNGHELVHAVEAGMTPLQAIECATANGPMTLGAMAPLSGQLKVGYDADFLLLKRNPLDDTEKPVR